MISLRPLTSTDTDALLALDHYAFAADPTQFPREHVDEGLRAIHAVGAEHPDRPDQLAGVYGTYDLRVRVPGPGVGTTRLVVVDGLTWVSVHPDLRRRGVLRAMMTHHLADARERGAAIAALHASEPGIYGRFGYSVASHDMRYTLARGTTLTAPEAVETQAGATTVTTVFDTDTDDIAARLTALYEAEPTLGTIVLPAGTVRHRLRDHPDTRRGREPRRALVAVRDGRDVGMAIYERAMTWEDGAPHGRVDVGQLVTLDAGALLALGRRLVDMDLMSTTEFRDRGLDDPLLAWAGSIRSHGIRISDALWLRPVDVGRMLTGRGYTGPVDLVLDITDATCPWNAGTWRLRTSDSGEATCDRTDTAADLAFSVEVLGEVFLGLRSPAALAAEGRIVEQAPGALVGLTRAVATGLAPIGGVMF